MGKQVIVVVGFILVVLTALFIWQTTGQTGTQSQIAPTEDPMDVTMELYRPWLAGLQATSTEFDRVELLASAPLTNDLQTRLLQVVESSQPEIDPVICQADIPERIGIKSVYTNESESQLMVVARGTKVPEQALVTLVAVDGQWVISDIVCSSGEVAPLLEYTFEREGNLLKQSLVPPLNNEQWHLIYTKDEVAGNVIPLLFDAQSVCISSDGSEQVCVPDQLTEATAVTIQGSMQEAGALVKRLELQ